MLFNVTMSNYHTFNLKANGKTILFSNLILQG
jgi:uncharacterized protein YegP (UPF0339 family)